MAASSYWPSYWALWFLRAVFCSYDPIFLSSIRILVVTLLTGVILLVTITVVVIVILFLIIFIILRFSFVVAVVELKQLASSL